MTRIASLGSKGRWGIATLLVVASVSLLGCSAGGPDDSASSATPTSDTVAPSTPAGLTAAAVSPSQINLSWSASTDNVAVTGYRVYRGGALLVTLGNVTTYQNTGLTAATTYTYTIRALDAAGNVSGASAAAGATTPAILDITPPTTPTGLTANAVSPSQINLSWTASTDNVAVTGYRVFRGGALLTTLGNVTTFQDTGLTAATAYTYTVRALDAAGNVSNASAAASATTLPTDTTAPTIPTALVATAVSATQINLNWSASTDNVAVTGYRVYRGGTLLVTLGNVTTYQNTGLTASTTYTYTVRALDAAGNVSGASTAASATTLASNTATLSWDAVTGASGYRIYHGTAPGTYFQSVGAGVNVGNVTTYTVTGLGSATRYYFAVTAYNASNVESALSNEAFKDIP